ncbi:enoyl-CoA hydratase [Qipengyuania flava]|uniref:enoyl-CoA hydratase n=1 Tax=Qipengyuania flava TaxID=192812 RepID=UPI001C632830|nr:enoyl-CoA hydratase [Qipengyuania flava]QYJ07470.1 enoyl-CoA hydratase [Qipengyuania flava]
MTQHVRIATEDRVTTVTLTRPEKKNAITQAMYGEMAEAIRAYGAGDEARAFVITGEGDYFTSGNDLQDFARGSSSDSKPPVVQFLEAVSTCEKPLIAAVNGPAIGVGLTMLLHCDLVFAAESATLSAPFVKLGLVPEAASSLLLPEAVGQAVANDIFLTGRALTADEALKFGLVSRVYTDGELQGAVDEVARLVAGSAPNAVKRTKSLVRDRHEAIAAQMQREGALFADQLASPDFAECVAAMMQKRAPVFA